MRHRSFAEILSEALDARGVTPTEAARWLGVNRSTVYHWLNGETTPSAGQSKALADLPRWLGMTAAEKARFLSQVAAALGYAFPSRPPPPAPSPIAHRRHYGTDGLPPFAGREPELAVLGSHLVGRRSVALVGAGGMGKTRLAQQLLDRTFADFDHGCDALTLSPDQTSAQVIRHVARLIGVDLDEATAAQDDGRAALAALRARTPTLDMLFLLDDVAHPDQVGALVRGLPGVTWLLTTRSAAAAHAVPLRHRLGPPDRADAVAMLLAHGRYAPLPDRDDTATAERIVERLGRLPLAVTLAAGLLANERLGSLAELDAWLVAGGLARRGVAAVKLRRFFERMIDSLPPPAGRAFEVCGAFAGPALSPAVLNQVDQAAGHGCPPDAWETLADYGLIETTADGRVHLHPLLHDYARDRLRAAPHGPAVRATYLAHYVALVEDAGRPPEMERDLRPLVPEEAELLAVAGALHTAGDWAGLQRLYPALTEYLWITGNYTAYGRVDRCCLDAAQALGNDEWASKILSELGYTEKEAGEWEAAEALFQQCQALYDATPERLIDRARVRRYRSEVALGLGDTEGALALLDEAEALLATATIDPPSNLNQALMLFCSARMTLHHRRGALDEAEADGRAALRLSQQVNGHGDFRIELGDILLRRGQAAEAVALWQNELPRGDDLPDRPIHAEARLRLAWHYATLGEDERARAMALPAAEAFGRRGQAGREALAGRVLAYLDAAGHLPSFAELTDGS